MPRSPASPLEHDQFAVEDQVHADAGGGLELGKVRGEVGSGAGLEVQAAAAEEGDDPVSVELLLPVQAGWRARRGGVGRASARIGAIGGFSTSPCSRNQLAESRTTPRFLPLSPAGDAAHARLSAGDQRRPLSRGPWDRFGLFSAADSEGAKVRSRFDGFPPTSAPPASKPGTARWRGLERIPSRTPPWKRAATPGPVSALAPSTCPRRPRRTRRWPTPPPPAGTPRTPRPVRQDRHHQARLRHVLPDPGDELRRDARDERPVTVAHAWLVLSELSTHPGSKAPAARADGPRNQNLDRLSPRRP